MKLALVTALFAAAVLAAPHRRSTLADRIARRRTALPKFVAAPHSETAGNKNEEYSGNWAGAIITSPPSGATFNGVSAQFVVPNPTVPSGGSSSQYAASAWVGIDGDTAQNDILQTGVDFYVNSDGSTSFDCWYEWFPNYAYDFSGITINAGDTMSISVTASDANDGVATITNLSNGQSVSQNLQPPSSSASLAGQNAEWIVEDFEEGSGQVPFANFGTVQFTNAGWTATDGSSGGTSGATIIDIEQNGQVLTSSSTPSDSEVDVSYTA